MIYVEAEVKTSQLRAAERKLDMELGALTERHIDMIGRYADPNVPVKTGFLKRSREKIWDPITKRGGQRWNAHYARWVHNGTRYMPARPFARNAQVRAAKELKHAITVLLRSRGK